MEKIIDLLNERRESTWLYYNAEDIVGQTKAWVLSKEYWFIHRLIEKDKINYDKAKKRCIWNDLYNNYRITREDALIWCIAIQEDPISFLASILK